MPYWVEHLAREPYSWDVSLGAEIMFPELVEMMVKADLERNVR